MVDRPDNIVPITSDVRTAAEKFSAEHDRELLTILFTDLVDSTKLQSDLGNVEAARLTELHRKIVRDELARYDAREIEWAGDSCLAVFTKPSEAVVFALRMQMKHRETRESEPRLLLVRVGMHLGEVVVKKRDDGGKKTEGLFGLQVSEAARVMSVARGNQIYCTRAVFDNAKGALKGSAIEGVGDIVWVNYGAYLLKGSEDPVELCEVGSSEIAILKAPQPSDKVRPAAVGSSESAPEARQGSQVMGWKLGVGVLAALALVATILLAVASMRESEPEPETQTAVSPPPTLEPAPPPEPKPIRRFALALRPDEPLQTPVFGQYTVALSRDGSLLVYVGEIDRTRMLVTRRLDQLDTRVLAGTEGAEDPFFSPDGKWIAFFADNKLKKIRADGGVPITLARSAWAVGGYWSDVDEILFTPGLYAGIYKVSAKGGPTEPVAVPEDGADPLAYLHPHLLPGGKTLLYSRSPRPDIKNVQIVLRHLDTGEEHILANGATRPLYAASGHIVYVQEGRLAAMPFDLDSVEAVGPTVEVSEELMTDLVSMPIEFAFSRDGTLIYAPGGAATTLNRRHSLVWVDREGGEKPIIAPVRAYGGPRISPDGTRLAVDIYEGEFDIWVFDLNRATLIRVTTHSLFDYQPIWEPDGRHLVFSSNRDGPEPHLYRILADGTSAPEALTFGSFGQFLPSFTPDGETLLFTGPPGDKRWVAYVLSLDGESEPQVLIKTRFNNSNTVVSPDGHWVAYISDESGQIEVYIQAYPDLGQRTQISMGGGLAPVWAPDGTELFYRSPTAMMAVKIQLSPTFEAGKPEELFSDDYYRDPGLNRAFDVSPLDGRFVMIKEMSDGAADQRTELMLVENWFEELKRLAPHPEAN